MQTKAVYINKWTKLMTASYKIKPENCQTGHTNMQILTDFGTVMSSWNVYSQFETVEQAAVLALTQRQWNDIHNFVSIFLNGNKRKREEETQQPPPISARQPGQQGYTYAIGQPTIQPEFEANSNPSYWIENGQNRHHNTLANQEFGGMQQPPTGLAQIHGQQGYAYAIGQPTVQPGFDKAMSNPGHWTENGQNRYHNTPANQEFGQPQLRDQGGRGKRGRRGGRGSRDGRGRTRHTRFRRGLTR